MMKSKKPSPKKKAPASAPTAPEDPRVRRLLEALAEEPGLRASVRELESAQKAKGRRSFGSNGLKTGGKLYALFTQGTLVVKLPNTRVAELVAAGVGTPFDPGHGRLMKGWLTVMSPKASWLELAKEAHRFVGSR
jgi:hypothetical protein